MCVKGWRVTSRASVVCVALALLLACARDGRAEALDAVLYRIFLTGGSSLVSYGEYSRVGDDVVFSPPIRAVQLAHTSVRFRQDAIRSNDMGTALDASAAASGALMLFTKSQGDLGRQLRAPALR